MNAERWIPNVTSGLEETLIRVLDHCGANLQFRIDVRPSLLINRHLSPNLMHTIQVDVRKTESWLLLGNVAALGQDGPPRIHDLSEKVISENEVKSGATMTRSAAPLKDPGNRTKANVPWRGPSLFGFVCAVQQLQRRSHRSAFRSRGFEEESPNELPRS